MKQDPKTDKDIHNAPLAEDSDIPTLQEALTDVDLADDEIETLSLDKIVLEDGLNQDLREQKIATLESIVFDGAHPDTKTPAPSADSGSSFTAAEDPLESPPKVTIPQPSEEVLHPELPGNPKPLPKVSNNPFLPQHILDRLNQGKRNLVEEIAQSGAALDASTAMLRTRTRAERQQKSIYNDPKSSVPTGEASDRTSVRQQQLIDNLIEEYLPLLASELRKRLKKILDAQDES